MEEYLVQMTGISKFFPGVTALDNVSFDLRKGEVHALLGENGAGKSTLMKIIGGIYQKDEGEVKIRGKTQEYSSVAQASALGIAVIHQELNMCRHLTVAENIFLGREIKKAGIVDFREQNRRAGELLKELSLSIAPDTVLGSLPVSKQQMVEIAKALSTDADIIIMDEPSSALTERETKELFRIIKDLKGMGKGIIYISHRLEELENIVDRVTILRDGKYIKTANFSDISISEIIALMVGREITEKYPHEQTKRGKKIMEVKGISTSEVQNISFELYAGEILGFAGLVGAGRTELVRALFGADRITAGEVVVDDKSVKLKNPRDAVRAGIVCAPEDRKKDGLLVNLDVKENIAIANLDTLSNPVGVLSSKRERDMAERAVKELKIKTPSLRSEVKNLSGGNQQKIVVGKWLMRDAKVIIFDEPTRGIDVAAKVEIYNLMNKLKRNGIGVMFVSSELPEVLGMSDRIIVMCSGRITGELGREEATQEKIMELATKFRTEVS
ncbi:MAG: sugar ABC transporter ATP-binding protein [Acutalibacteraceae bacterium]